MVRERTPVLKMLQEREPRSPARSRQQFVATAFPPPLLGALRFPPFSPVLAHPHRHRSPRSSGHRATPAARAPCHPAVACLRLTAAAEQLGKLATDRCFFLAQLLEPRHRAQPCKPAQLFLTKIGHASSRRNPCSVSNPCLLKQASCPATPA